MIQKIDQNDITSPSKKFAKNADKCKHLNLLNINLDNQNNFPSNRSINSCSKKSTNKPKSFISSNGKNSNQSKHSERSKNSNQSKSKKYKAKEFKKPKRSKVKKIFLKAEPKMNQDPTRPAYRTDDIEEIEIRTANDSANNSSIFEGELGFLLSGDTMRSTRISLQPKNDETLKRTLSNLQFDYKIGQGGEGQV